MYWENAVRLTHLQEKYIGLVGELVGANKLEAQDAFNEIGRAPARHQLMLSM